VKTKPAKPDIAIPRIGDDPDTGIHRSKIRGVRYYRLWWWENGVTKSTVLRNKDLTIEQVREARDKFYTMLVAGGAVRRDKGAKTPQARIRNAKLRGSKRQPYISAHVNVRGVFVGSFPTMDEAVTARDQYLKGQAEIRRQLLELKRARA
jgi:hypothetical protein